MVEMTDILLYEFNAVFMIFQSGITNIELLLSIEMVHIHIDPIDCIEVSPRQSCMIAWSHNDLECAPYCLFYSTGKYMILNI